MLLEDIRFTVSIKQHTKINRVGGKKTEFIKVAVGDVNIYRWDRNSDSDFISFTGCEGKRGPVVLTGKLFEC